VNSAFSLCASFTPWCFTFLFPKIPNVTEVYCPSPKLSHGKWNVIEILFILWFNGKTSFIYLCYYFLLLIIGYFIIIMEIKFNHNYVFDTQSIKKVNTVWLFSPLLWEFQLSVYVVSCGGKDQNIVLCVVYLIPYRIPVTNSFIPPCLCKKTSLNSGMSRQRHMLKLSCVFSLVALVSFLTFSPIAGTCPVENDSVGG
jgi:hypothetical protein